MPDLFVHNIGLLATPLMADRQRTERFVLERRNAAILVREGRIVEIGPERELESRMPADCPRFNADGCLATPGLIDCHTHPVFTGNRADEFHMRNAGRSYQEIAVAGGGIQATARKVRAAAVDQIVKESLPRFDRSLAAGVTTIEAKSGYGLDWDGEAKLLRALELISLQTPQRMHKTFLIHAVPEAMEGQRERFLDEVAAEMIPRVAELKLASAADVFCEQGAFSVDESRRMLRAALDHGLQVAVHANQFGHSGGALLAAELGARSADHLEYLNDQEITALAKANVCAVMLPASVFFLGTLPYPPARKLIEQGARVAIATDMNPGSAMTESMPFCMTAAAIYAKMNPAELLWAVTLDAAAALRADSDVGSLEAGKAADICLWRAPDLNSLSYHLGDFRAFTVIIGGELAWEDRDATARY
ncbi:imidazolonepropionase [candidate division KSB1 bacterium]|nr:imidazolonepropionase [candidate division KSB1 bacterium]